MPEARRDRLREELVRLKLRSSISDRAMAAAIGAKHGTVRRIRIGETLPKVQHVRLWLDAVAAVDPSLVDNEARQRLLDLAEAAHAETRGWDELLGTAGHAQAEVLRREREATRVRNYQDEIVPGLLQTPEYARAYFELGTTKDIDAAVAARIERQKVLRAGRCEFVFLIAERVLLRPLGGAQVLAEQRDRIVSLAQIPGVTVAVLPTSPVVAVPWHNFTVWDTPDGPYALAEVVFGQRETSDEQDLQRVEGIWTRLWSAAVQGEAALRLIRKVAQR